MNILIATGSHKDFLSSAEAAGIVRSGLAEILPGAAISILPVADGGDGTLDAFLFSWGGREVSCLVKDPLFRDIPARIAVFEADTRTAVIETALASGSALLKPEERNSLYTTSFGTGQLIRFAMDQGCRRVIIGLGGSIVSEAAMGAAYALGARFLDRTGCEVERARQSGYSVCALPLVDRIDVSGLDPRIPETDFVVAADVDIPMLGPQGQARTFGPQKNATAEDIDTIEYALTNYVKVLYECFGRHFNIPCAGAAGGMGGGLTAILGATLVKGIDFVLDSIRFDEKIRGSDWVVTGEGCFDSTSLTGKACIEVSGRARARHVPVAGIFGALRLEPGIVRRQFDCFVDASRGERVDVHEPGFREAGGKALLRDAARRLGLQMKQGPSLSS